MAYYTLSRPSPSRWNIDGMSNDAVAEMRQLVERIADYMDGPDFPAKAVGYDALAVAKKYQDLYSLRLYDRLFPTGAPARDIVNAVRASKRLPGGLPELTLEQVASHATVWKAMKDGNYTGLEGNAITELALEYPGQTELIVDLMMNRQMDKADQIRDFIVQVGDEVVPLHNGLL